MKQYGKWMTILSFALTGFGVVPAQAFNEPTHVVINERITRQLDFDTLLKRQLGLLRGVDEPLRGLRIFEWVGAGGDREDEGLREFLHFHDPLQSWEAAGVQVLFRRFESSIRWMQSANQAWSWQRARDHYHTALTLRVTNAEDSVRREQAFADTFRALGQIMHLVVDASVPEHTRNDIHPLEAICQFVGFSCYGNYEHWVGAQHGRPGSNAESTFINNYLAQPIGFDAAILRQPTGDDIARVPVARLIDTNTYTGADPSVTLNPAIGIAEVANANFFSEDTGSRRFLGRNYPFPALALLEPSTHPVPLTGRARSYFRKQINPATGFAADGGLPVDPALAECVLDESAQRDGVLEPRAFACTDENVWAQAAQAMLPRAVGYAQGVLDYFFRGQIEIAAPERFVYALNPFTEGNTGAFTSLRFKVRNATADEAAGVGTMVAVVQYRTSPGNLFEDPLAPLSETRFTAVSAPQAVALTETFQELTFDFQAQPIPTNSADLFLTLVYRGPLGLEEDAVVIGGKDIPEPDPLYVINATDYDCFAGAPHFVAGLPPTSRDLNGDGRQDLFGPDLERGVLVKIDRFNVRLAPSAQRFDFAIPEITGGQYARFVLLQDEPLYDVGVLSDEFRDTSTGQLSKRFVRFFRSSLIFNLLSLDENGQVRRQVSFFPLEYRGLRLLHGVVTVPPNGRSCFAQTFTLPPNVTEVPGTLPPE